jgi:N-acyl homoserine lactone hydrolase
MFSPDESKRWVEMTAMIPSLHVLSPGYLRRAPNGTILEARSSVTLVCTGRMNIIIDTGLPGDGDRIMEGLAEAGLKPSDVDVVVNTHDHKDHTGENRLFTGARIICGYRGLEKSGGRIQIAPVRVIPTAEHRMVLDPNVQVIRTPGHTRDSISVVMMGVSSNFAGPADTMIAAGDALPTEANYLKGVPPAISYDSTVSLQSMAMITSLADCVIPGHDKPFRVRI